MALVNISNLYSGAAQVFDNRSHLAFQARLLQHHAAQQQALDDYYRKMPLSINEKGTRDFDRDELNKSALDFKNYWLQNIKAIRNGGEEAFEYEKKIRNHKDLVNSSLANGLTDAQIGKLRNNPATKHLFNTEDVVEQIRLSHLPVNHPEHKDFDLETFTQGEKQLVLSDYMKRYDKIKLDDDKSVVNNPDGTMTITNTPRLSEGAKNSIMSGATFDYVSSPSVKQAIDNLGTADETNPLNPIFKQHYGRDIVSPIDVNAALIIANKVPSPTTQVIKQDQLAMTQQRQQFAKQQQARQFAHSNELQRKAQGYRKAIIDYKSDKSVEENESVLSKFVGTSFDAGNKRFNGATVNRIRIDGTPYEGKFIDVPKAILNEYRVIGEDPKTKEAIYVYPDRFYLTNDKKTIIPLFFGDKTASGGNYIKKESKPIPIQLYKASLAKILLTKKDTGGEVTADELTNDEGNQQETPTKSTTKKDPLGLFK